MTMAYKFPARTESLEAIMQTAEKFALDAGCVRCETMNFLLATEELLVNIISYAYDETGGEIEVSLDKQDGMITVEISDCGQLFNPLEAKDPDISLSIDEREPGGLGIYLVKKLSLSLEYKRIGNKNVITAVFPCGG